MTFRPPCAMFVSQLIWPAPLRCRGRMQRGTPDCYERHVRGTIGLTAAREDSLVRADHTSANPMTTAPSNNGVMIGHVCIGADYRKRAHLHNKQNAPASGAYINRRISPNRSVGLLYVPQSMLTTPAPSDAPCCTHPASAASTGACTPASCSATGGPGVPARCAGPRRCPKGASRNYAAACAG